MSGPEEPEMPPAQRPDDTALNDLLAGRGAVLGAYRAAAREQPPAALDAVIVQAAQAAARPQASRRQARRPRWAPSLATAAVLVLSFGVLLQVQRDPVAQQALREPPVAARAAPATAEPQPAAAATVAPVAAPAAPDRALPEIRPDALPDAPPEVLARAAPQPALEAAPKPAHDPAPSKRLREAMAAPAPAPALAPTAEAVLTDAPPAPPPPPPAAAAPPEGLSPVAEAQALADRASAARAQREEALSAEVERRSAPAAKASAPARAMAALPLANLQAAPVLCPETPPPGASPLNTATDAEAAARRHWQAQAADAGLPPDATLYAERLGVAWRVQRMVEGSPQTLEFCAATGALMPVGQSLQH